MKYIRTEKNVIGSGYKYVETQRQDYEFILLELSEYNKFKSQENTIKKLRADINELQNQNQAPSLDDIINRTTAQEKSIQEKLKKENEDLKRQLAIERQANKDFKRIATERANAQRGIKPKKEHSGYIVLTQGEGILNKKMCWHIRLQTPLAAGMSKNYVKQQIDEIFKPVKNLIIKEEFKENYTAGLWEVDIFAEKYISFNESMKPKAKSQAR